MVYQATRKRIKTASGGAKSGFAGSRPFPLRTARPAPRIQKKAAGDCGGECPGCRSRLLSPPRPNLGAATDRYERRADAAADRVLRTPARGHTPETAGSAMPDSVRAGGGEAQRSRGGGREGESLAGYGFGSGRSLPESTRRFYESRFGRDFGGIRIHSDPRAARAARAINARAFTVGRDIVFGPGAYAPATSAGARLLAHELTHTIQQAGGALTASGGREAPVLQGQFEKPPQTPPPPDYECKIDLVMAARVLAGDKQAALKVLDCCLSHLPVVGRGCTSSVVSAACKLFPDLCEKKKKGKKEPACPVGFKPSHAFKGKCCPEGRPIEMEQECCAPGEIISNFAFSRCCRPPYVPNDDRTACVLPRLSPCSPDRETPLFDPRIFAPRFACECLPASRQNLDKGTCCPVGEVGTTGTCVPEGKKPKPAPPMPPRYTVLRSFDIGFAKDAPQAWFDPRSSFRVSVTGGGKAEFRDLVSALRAHPEERVRLEGRASSDKPAHDGDYNRRLTDRRVRLIVGELRKRKIDAAARVADFPGQGPEAGCEEIAPGQWSCGDYGARKPPDKKDRKVVARLFR